jgi:hypothetical protein
MFGIEKHPARQRNLVEIIGIKDYIQLMMKTTRHNHPSFPRRQVSSSAVCLDSRLRGNDGGARASGLRGIGFVPSEKNGTPNKSMTYAHQTEGGSV